MKNLLCLSVLMLISLSAFSSQDAKKLFGYGGKVTQIVESEIFPRPSPFDKALYEEYRVNVSHALNVALSGLQASKSGTCMSHVNQMQGGLIFRVTFSDCTISKEEQTKIEDALMRAFLPHEGYQSVYGTEILFLFCTSDLKCAVE